MSRDESSLPAATGAVPGPEPGGQDSPPQGVEGPTLRRQVLGLINDVLTDTAPEGEWARTQLRRLLAANPNEPERALLQHLITVTTTDLTDSAADDGTPRQRLGRSQGSTAYARYLPASPDRRDVESHLSRRARWRLARGDSRRAQGGSARAGTGSQP